MENGKIRMTPQEAGRKGGLVGGKSRSAVKIAACRKNGFQKTGEAPSGRKAGHIADGSSLQQQQPVGDGGPSQKEVQE